MTVCSSSQTGPRLEETARRLRTQRLFIPQGNLDSVGQVGFGGQGTRIPNGVFQGYFSKARLHWSKNPQLSPLTATSPIPPSLHLHWICGTGRGVILIFTQKQARNFQKPVKSTMCQAPRLPRRWFSLPLKVFLSDSDCKV